MKILSRCPQLLVVLIIALLIVVGASNPTTSLLFNRAQAQRNASESSNPRQAQCSAGNLVLNGSFETPNASATNFIDIYAPNTFSGWVVNSGSVGVTANWQDAAGNQSLDLAGNSVGSVYQDICTVAGGSYTLSFALAANPNEQPTIKTVEIWWNNQKVDTLTVDATGRTITNMGWQYHEYMVQATGNSTRLMFKDAYTGTSRSGPVIDDVSIYAPTPTATATATNTTVPTATNTTVPTATATNTATSTATPTSIMMSTTTPTYSMATTTPTGEPNQCPSGNVVSNGSFETPNASATDFIDIYAPSTFSGWVVNSGSVGVTANWQDADGNQSLDLAGNSVGSVYQDLCTTPGQPYHLAFSLAANPNEQPTVKTIEVWWNNQKIDAIKVDATGRTINNMGWKNHEYMVQATGNSTRLMFKDAYSGTSRSGPVIDAVLVEQEQIVAPANTIYLPLILDIQPTFPITINAQAISVRPITALGDVYFSTGLVLPTNLPQGGHFYFSSDPTTVKAVTVDDELVVVVGGQEVYKEFLTLPRIVEVPRATLQQWIGQPTSIVFRDAYGSVISSSPVWLIWVP